MQYISSPDFRHEGADRVGILLVNFGSPDSLATRDVRSFLRKLLSDPRVIELPRLLWLPILYGFILPFRPAKIAHKYQSIWTDQGSPLLSILNQLRSGLAKSLAHRMLEPLSIEIGLLYSRPSVPEALARLREAGAQRVLVVPMFPQYCGSTTGSVYDQVNAELRRWRWLPELRFISEYHDSPGYIEALRASVVEHWQKHGRTKHFLISFHGIPERYFHQGDPYFVKCQRTAHLLAEALNLPADEWTISFQSRFGAARWLGPYTIDMMAALPKRGVDEITVICPGFTVDCLETLEEIEVENRDVFLASGGRKFSYVPALNARADHAQLYADLITQHCQGWASDELAAAAAVAIQAASA